MSRNDQVTRQWLLLQILEKPGDATIEELARSLPADAEEFVESLHGCFPAGIGPHKGYAEHRGENRKPE